MIFNAFYNDYFSQHLHSCCSQVFFFLYIMLKVSSLFIILNKIHWKQYCNFALRSATLAATLAIEVYEEGTNKLVSWYERYLNNGNVYIENCRNCRNESKYITFILTKSLFTSLHSPLIICKRILLPELAL